MYSPKVIARNIDEHQARHNVTLKPITVGNAQDWREHLESLMGPKGALTRPLNNEERFIIKNEIALSMLDFRYWANRYCNPPEAPIWMGDLSFKPLGSIEMGDIVVGWEDREPASTDLSLWWRKRDGNTGRRHFERMGHFTHSLVIGVSRRKAEVIRVIMESGRELFCTPEHLWSSGHTYRGRQPWITAEPNRLLRRFVDPILEIDTDLQWVAGWLAGIYDGEGTGTTISQCPNHNPGVFKRIGEALTRLGIPHSVSTEGGKTGYNIVGGKQSYVRFLNVVNPVKRDRLEALVLGWCVADLDRVEAVESAGEREVISMQTSTGNYVAWGYASKNCHIAYDGVEGGGVGLFNFWEAQEIILTHFSRIEEENYEAKDEGYPVEGIKVVDHKARQLGGTMFARAAGMHRQTLYRDQRAMGASVDEDKILELYNRDKLIWDNLPWYLQPKIGFDVKAEHLSFEALNSFILYQHSKMQSGLGQGRQFDFGHLTECSSFPYPRMIELDFFPTLPQSIMTLCILESTAQGRGNWWHEFTEGVRNGYHRGWNYIFVPVYAERKKYRARVPEGWNPGPMTRLYAKKILETSHEWIGHKYTAPKEHLYWWETERDAAVKSGVLNIFLTNYCATPEESFQHTNVSAFPPEVLENLRLRAKMGKPFEFLPSTMINAN